ncbi:hypothetical protein TARUN_7167, partial [Trichoderma arundinaceum]
LGGPAATWFDPILKDHRDNQTTPDKREEQTKVIFEKYENFEEQLQKTFGTVNEEQEAENQLRVIRQKGALAKHTVNFIQLLTKVDWTEATKKDVYYQSLKPKVKDELYRVNRQKTSWTDYTQQAIDIDNRIWEREQERKHEKNGNQQNFHHSPRNGNRNTANQGRRRDDYVASSNDTRPGRMDLSSIICYNCKEPGHKSFKCPKKNNKDKKDSWKPAEENKKATKEVGAIVKDEHASFH